MSLLVPTCALLIGSYGPFNHPKTLGSTNPILIEPSTYPLFLLTIAVFLWLLLFVFFVILFVFVFLEGRGSDLLSSECFLLILYGSADIVFQLFSEFGNHLWIISGLVCLCVCLFVCLSVFLSVCLSSHVRASFLSYFGGRVGTFLLLGGADFSR